MTELDEDIKKKYDLRTAEGKKNAKRAQDEKWDLYHKPDLSILEKLFRFLQWTLIIFFVACIVVYSIGEN